MSVRIVQCLCPSRHCIIGFAYEPGITSAQWNALRDITLIPENAAGYLRDKIVPRMIEMGQGPCGLCGAKPETWIYEDSNSIFETLEEAMPVLQKAEAEQMATRAAMRMITKAAQN